MSWADVVVAVIAACGVLYLFTYIFRGVGNGDADDGSQSVAPPDTGEF